MSKDSVETKELIKLCAVNNWLYEKTFFGRTVRQTPPPFHAQVDKALAGPDRYVALMIHRDGAKTSKFRMFVSKRIAYGLTRTGLLVSNSQSHSVKSLEWIKRQVEFNLPWANTFKLRRGGKWTGEEIEIIHGVDEYPIHILALGITGQIRGFNIDDYRPDFIGADDIDNEESAGSMEQIKKTSELFHGALAKSLAPASEAPHAKMVLMQTPIARGDVISVCQSDPQWKTLKFGCFDESGESSWPERYPTEVLLADKAAHVQRGQLALWMREKECELVPDGGASFNPENIKLYDLLPEKMVYLISIDPASSNAKTADDQVIMVLGFWKTRVYIVEYSAEKGEMPEVAGMKVLEYIRRYPILGIYSEAIGYQRVLANYLEGLMRSSRAFVPVHQIQDRRKKSDRILQAIGRKAGYGLLYVRAEHSKFLTQYGRYSPLSDDHDDVLDAAAQGIEAGDKLNIPDWIEGEYEVTEEESYKQLEFRSCP